MGIFMFASMTSMKAKVALLDRDGVINFDSPDYILVPDQWRPEQLFPEAHAKVFVKCLENEGIFISKSSALKPCNIKFKV